MNNFSVSPKDLNKFLKYYYDIQSDRLSKIIEEKDKQIEYYDKYIERIKTTLDDLTELQNLKDFKLAGTFKWSKELVRTGYHQKLTDNNICKLFKTGENDKLDDILYSNDVIILEYEGDGYIFTNDGTLNHEELSDISKFINTNRINFSERLRKCFSFIYHVRLTDRNDKSKSVSIDNLEAGTWQEAVDKVISDHPEFGLKPGDYNGSDKVEVHWNYGENTLKSF